MSFGALHGSPYAIPCHFFAMPGEQKQAPGHRSWLHQLRLGTHPERSAAHGDRDHDGGEPTAPRWGEVWLQGGRNQFLGQKKGQFEGSFTVLYLLLLIFYSRLKVLILGRFHDIPRA